MFSYMSSEAIERIIFVLAFFCIILIFSAISAFRKKNIPATVTCIVNLAILLVVIYGSMRTLQYKVEMHNREYPICHVCGEQYYAGFKECPYCDGTFA